jgi:hypothetical protein
MRRVTVSLLGILVAALIGSAQSKAGSPGEAVISFYVALREKRYVEGFRHSVYRAAVEGLTTAELQDLEADFMRTFSTIPEKIELKGEQITGDTAVVYLKFPDTEQAQPVSLVRVDKEWLVGDQEALNVVKTQGLNFFFNARISVNEGEVAELIARIVDAEIIYSRKFEGRCASLAELIKLGGVSKDLEDQQANGYSVVLTLARDQKTFSVIASPISYGKTGRLSFYADVNGTRAEDRKGQPATLTSPLYTPK